MAGAGIEATYDSQFLKILETLEKASMPDIEAVAGFIGGELHDISNTAFQKREDPVTGERWADLKYPYKGDKKSTLRRGGILFVSRNWITEGGKVIYGSNMEYARIHQEGGKTKAHEIKARNGKALSFTGRDGKQIARKSVKHPGSQITARPYMGVPKDFDRRLLEDPAVLKLLGLGGV
jgi:phage gpG-like protein